MAHPILLCDHKLLAVCCMRKQKMNPATAAEFGALTAIGGELVRGDLVRALR